MRGETDGLLEKFGVYWTYHMYLIDSGNPYCDRIVGTFRRECLDHMIILNEKHLRSVLKEYSEYYNRIRPHLSLNRNFPIPRIIEKIENNDITSSEILGGLHHSYSRAV